MKKILFLLILAALLLSACQLRASRNSDGTATVEATISQQELQDVITAAIADPLVQSVTVSLQSGYVLVAGERQRLNDNSKTDALSFRLDLGVNDSYLTAAISDAQLDGVSIEQSRVDEWSTRISNRLSIIGQKNANSSLQSVSITPEAVTMTWLVIPR